MRVLVEDHVVEEVLLRPPGHVRSRRARVEGPAHLGQQGVPPLPLPRAREPPVPVSCFLREGRGQGQKGGDGREEEKGRMKR